MAGGVAHGDLIVFARASATVSPSPRVRVGADGALSGSEEGRVDPEARTCTSMNIATCRQVLSQQQPIRTIYEPSKQDDVNAQVSRNSLGWPNAENTVPVRIERGEVYGRLIKLACIHVHQRLASRPGK